MNKTPKITLSMIVKNEEKNLRECFESIKDVVDEIVLVDTGSTDKTINIAEEFDAKVYQYKWANDFSSARNFALSKSTGKWILYLDADEKLSEKSIAELNKVTENNNLIGCRCIVNNLDEHNGKPNYMRYTRLFRNNSKIKFSGAVHEQIDNSLLENGYEIINTEVEIIHTGYNLSGEELRHKAQRNLAILKKEYEKSNTAYGAFQIANTYSLLKDYETAYKYYSIAVGKDDLNNEFKAHAYLNLSDYEFKKHNIARAIEFLETGLNIDSSNALLNLLACDIYFRINLREKALEYCKKALKENKKIMAANNESTFAVRLEPDLIISKGIYCSLLSSNNSNLNFFMDVLRKENSKVAFYIDKFIQSQSFSSNEKKEIIKIVKPDNLDVFLFCIENYNDKKTALEILLSLKNQFKNNSKYLKTLGLLFFENKFYDEAVKEYEESLLLKEKDPASVFYLVSALVESNQIEKIPDLLLFAEKEFGNIPEFNDAFESLKQKLNKLFSVKTLQ